MVHPFHAAAEGTSPPGGDALLCAVTPDLDAENSSSATMMGTSTASETRPSSRAPRNAPATEPPAIAATNQGCTPSTAEGLVSAVTEERHHHCAQRDQQRQASGQFRIDPVQQHDRGDQQFASGYAHDRGDDADAEPGKHTGDGLRGRRQGQRRDRTCVLGSKHDRRLHATGTIRGRRQRVRTVSLRPARRV